MNPVPVPEVSELILYTALLQVRFQELIVPCMVWVSLVWQDFFLDFKLSFQGL